MPREEKTPHPRHKSGRANTASHQRFVRLSSPKTALIPLPVNPGRRQGQGRVAFLLAFRKCLRPVRDFVGKSADRRLGKKRL